MDIGQLSLRTAAVAGLLGAAALLAAGSQARAAAWHRVDLLEEIRSPHGDAGVTPASAALDAGGAAVVAGLSGDGRVVVRTRPAAGAAWGAWVRLGPGGGTPVAATARGEVVVAAAGPAGGIRVWRRGRSGPWRQAVDRAGPAAPPLEEPLVRLGADGTAWVLWPERSPGGTVVRLGSLTRAGRWRAAAGAPPAAGRGITRHALSPTGHAVVAWAASSGALNAVIARPGAGWEAPLSLSPAGAGAASAPAVAVSPAGTVLVAWHEPAPATGAAPAVAGMRLLVRRPGDTAPPAAEDVAPPTPDARWSVSSVGFGARGLPLLALAGTRAGGPADLAVTLRLPAGGWTPPAVLAAVGPADDGISASVEEAGRGWGVVTVMRDYAQGGPLPDVFASRDPAGRAWQDTRLPHGQGAPVVQAVAPDASMLAVSDDPLASATHGLVVLSRDSARAAGPPPTVAGVRLVRSAGRLRLAFRLSAPARVSGVLLRDSAEPGAPASVLVSGDLAAGRRSLPLRRRALPPGGYRVFVVACAPVTGCREVEGLVRLG